MLNILKSILRSYCSNEAYFSLAFSHGWRHWAGCPQSVFGGDFNTGVSLLEFTFPLFCLSGPAQANLPKVVLGKYVTVAADQKYQGKNMVL